MRETEHMTARERLRHHEEREHFRAWVLGAASAQPIRDALRESVRQNAVERPPCPYCNFGRGQSYIVLPTLC